MTPSDETELSLPTPADAENVGDASREPDVGADDPPTPADAENVSDAAPPPYEPGSLEQAHAMIDNLQSRLSAAEAKIGKLLQGHF